MEKHAANKAGGLGLRGATEAATRKHTVSKPKAYEKINIRVVGSNSKFINENPLTTNGGLVGLSRFMPA